MKTEAGDSRREDPIGSEAPRGKDCSERRHRNDPGLTGTEKTLKANLMQQFRRTGEGPGAPSQAFRENYDLIDWAK